MSVVKRVAPVVSASMMILASQAMARVASPDVRDVSLSGTDDALKAEAGAAMAKPAFKGALAGVARVISHAYGESGESLHGQGRKLAYVACPGACDADATNAPTYQGYNPDVFNGYGVGPNHVTNERYFSNNPNSTILCFSACYVAYYYYYNN